MGRPRKYANEEERKEARAQQERNRRAKERAGTQATKGQDSYKRYESMEESILPHNDFESDAYHEKLETKSIVCQGCFYCFPNFTEYQVHQNECSHVSVNQNILKRSKSENGIEHESSLPRMRAMKLTTSKYSCDSSYMPLPNRQTLKEHKIEHVNKSLRECHQPLLRAQLLMGCPRKYANEQERKQARVQQQRDHRDGATVNTNSYKRYENIEEPIQPHDDFESNLDVTMNTYHEEREVKSILCPGCRYCFPTFAEYQVHRNECLQGSLNQNILKSNKSENRLKRKPSSPRKRATKLTTLKYSCDPSYLPLPNRQAFEERKIKPPEDKSVQECRQPSLMAQLRDIPSMGCLRKYGNEEEKEPNRQAFEERKIKPPEDKSVQECHQPSLMAQLRDIPSRGCPRKYGNEEEKEQSQRYANMEESIHPDNDCESDSDVTLNEDQEQQETKSIVCRGCRYCFPTFAEYQVHENECSSLKEKNCTLLNENEKLKHCIQRCFEWVCEICHLIFSREELYKKHVKFHLKLKKNGMEQEIRQELNEDKWRKIIRTLEEIETLDADAKSATNNAKPYRCTLCKYVSGCKTRLRSHVLMYHMRKSLRKCKILRKTRLSTCDDCSFSTADHSAIVYHKFQHEKTYPYPCSVCCARFKDKYKLDNHMLTQHSQQMDDDSGSVLAIDSATSFSRIESFDEDRVRVTLRLSGEEYLLPNVPVEETENFSDILVKDEPLCGFEVKEELISGTEVNNEERVSLTEVKEEPSSPKSSKDQRVMGDHLMLEIENIVLYPTC